MKFQILAATAAAVIAASPAAAANFSGLRAEVTAGRASDSVKADFNNNTTPFTRKQDDVSDDGADFPNVDSCDSVFGSDEFCYSAKRNYSLGARAGVKIGGSILAYGKAGYSSGRFKAVYHNVTDPTQDVEGADNQRGIHYGVGAELALGSFYGKAEYLRTDYQEGDLGHDVARDQFKVGVGLRV